MTFKRMDNDGIVVEGIDAAMDLFTELDCVLKGGAPIERDWARRPTGLPNLRWTFS